MFSSSTTPGKDAVPLAAHSAYAPPPKKTFHRGMLLRGHTGYLFFGCRTPHKNTCVRVVGPPKTTNVEDPIGRRGGRSYFGGGLSSHPPTRRVGKINSPATIAPRGTITRTVRRVAAHPGRGWRTSGRFRFIRAPHWVGVVRPPRVRRVTVARHTRVGWGGRRREKGKRTTTRKRIICHLLARRFTTYRTGRRGGCARHASRAIHGRGAWRIEQHLHGPFWTTRSLGMRFAQPGNTAT
jgi:hypothetical protein